jgi:hypothetical protein
VSREVRKQLREGKGFDTQMERSGIEEGQREGIDGSKSQVERGEIDKKWGK